MRAERLERAVARGLGLRAVAHVGVERDARLAAVLVDRRDRLLRARRAARPPRPPPRPRRRGAPRSRDRCRSRRRSRTRRARSGRSSRRSLVPGRRRAGATSTAMAAAVDEQRRPRSRTRPRRSRGTGAQAAISSGSAGAPERDELGGQRVGLVAGDAAVRGELVDGDSSPIGVCDPTGAHRVRADARGSVVHGDRPREPEQAGLRRDVGGARRRRREARDGRDEHDRAAAAAASRCGKRGAHEQERAREVHVERARASARRSTSPAEPPKPDARVRDHDVEPAERSTAAATDREASTASPGRRVTGDASPPVAAATASSGSGRRPVTATSRLRPRKRRAMAAPIPCRRR